MDRWIDERRRRRGGRRGMIPNQHEWTVPKQRSASCTCSPSLLNNEFYYSAGTSPAAPPAAPAAPAWPAARCPSTWWGAFWCSSGGTPLRLLRLLTLSSASAFSSSSWMSPAPLRTHSSAVIVGPMCSLWLSRAKSVSLRSSNAQTAGSGTGTVVMDCNSARMIL